MERRRRLEGRTVPVLAACLGLALGLGAGPAVAQEAVVVIAHQDAPVSRLRRQEVSDLFLKKAAVWKDGTQAVPVDFTETAPARAQFSTAIHRRSVAAVEAYWQKMIFSGREVPPTEKLSAAEVVAFVRSHPGALGYVPAGTPLGPGVKVVTVVP
jgi:ABC-type phosphate transport system substrate-binding protein